jgi:DNA-binding SARP family transcriptional activator/tetratricopeptide (TPR) repeat protein
VEVSLRERKTREERRIFIESITAASDSDLFAFLAEEVLDQQDDRTRSFLLATSILQQIAPELAERLTGADDGAKLLAELEQRGLFTYRLDTVDARYRFHGLFRDFLERHLMTERSEGEIAGLHIHAASYYETNREWPEAIHHYLRAGLHPQAARLIARYGEDVASEGRLSLIDEWLAVLPRKTSHENARLSLLLGEVQGMRGEWEGALVALRRARAFFERKGDKRMEALACSKLSTVLANYGKITEAVQMARDGLALAPESAEATRLRLRGNLAITAGWIEASFDEVIHEFRRIVVEAKARGWEHFAAIGLHNLGSAQRQVGDIADSVRSLDLAARYWGDVPKGPFADNAELVASLLAADQAARAEAVARMAIVRTAPWPRPHAEAQYGMALVFAHNGRFRAAIELLRSVLSRPDELGPTAHLVGALLIECLYLSEAGADEIAREHRALSSAETDPRLEPMLTPADAIAKHASGCLGECLTATDRLTAWDARGATYSVTVARAKVLALGLEHSTKSARSSIEILKSLIAMRALRPLRWWLRRYTKIARLLAASREGDAVLIALANADPEGWRAVLVDVLPALSGRRRELVLDAIVRHATRDTENLLREVPGEDVAGVRRVLVQKQAPLLFVQSFGALTMRRGSWDGPVLPVDRRRMRTLLGLLVAYSGSTLTRDMVLDMMWPDSDPSAAVNSLNQTVFQLRRAIDGSYRDGASPQYVMSTVDVVQFNPELVRTDISEFRVLAADVSSGGRQASARASAIIRMIHGPFLNELRYEDWAARIQMAVHAEVRDFLLPLATTSMNLSPDLRIRAASALIDLDEFDDDAYIALAEHLAKSGRQVAARDVIIRYAKRIEDELAEAPASRIADLMSELGSRSQTAESTNN